MNEAKNDAVRLPSLATLFIEAGFASLYLAALVFLAGWSYADAFFADLGLNLSAIDGMDEATFSAYALWVFRDGVLTVGALAVALIAGVFLVRRAIGLGDNLLIAVGIPALALTTLIGAAKLGAARAHEQVPLLFQQNYANFVRIGVFPKKDSVLRDVFADRGDLGATTCLRKIFMDHKYLYVYAGYESSKAPRQPIMIVPLSEIALIETVANDALCKP